MRGEWKTQILTTDRYSLHTTLAAELQRGWEVLYCIPAYNPNPATRLQTTFDGKIEVVNSPVANMFEVCLVKFNDPDPTCPTCSHLNPDRIDRQV